VALRGRRAGEDLVSESAGEGAQAEQEAGRAGAARRQADARRPRGGDSPWTRAPTRRRHGRAHPRRHEHERYARRPHPQQRLTPAGRAPPSPPPSPRAPRGHGPPAPSAPRAPPGAALGPWHLTGRAGAPIRAGKEERGTSIVRDGVERMNEEDKVLVEHDDEEEEEEEEEE
jgi:hypothetical protein